MGMTLEELRDYVDQQRDLDNIPYHVYSTLIDGIDTLEQEPIDYKTQYENYLKKSEVVISQLRTDRDRLQDAFDKVRAEIKQYQSDYDVHGTEYDRTAWKAFNRCLQIIDKYKAEGSDKE